MTNEDREGWTTVNPTIEVLDLSEAYCPQCGPNHILENGGVGRRESPARCDGCGWEGTNGDLIDFLAKLDDDADEDGEDAEADEREDLA